MPAGHGDRRDLRAAKKLSRGTCIFARPVVHYSTSTSSVRPTGRDERQRRVPVAQLDRAFDYESKGREFESLRARHAIPGVAELADAHDSKSCGKPCRFESGLRDQRLTGRPCGAIAQLGERQNRTLEASGSNPLSSTTFLDSSAVEHPAVNRRVVGSNPTRGAIELPVKRGCGYTLIPAVEMGG